MTDFGLSRVSSEEQKNRGKRIRLDTDEFIKAGVLPENIYIDEGKTGGLHEETINLKWKEPKLIIEIDIKHRNKLRQLMNLIKPGDNIYLSEWSRISRNNDFLNFLIRYLEREGATLIPLNDTKERLLRKIKGLISEDELYRTEERNNNIFLNLYERGLHPYRAMLGYDKNIKINGKLKYPLEPEGTLIIKPEEAAIIKQIYQETNKGISNKEICQKHKIDLKTYHNIIRNPIYKGQITYYKNEWVGYETRKQTEKTKKGNHEPIIPTDDWEKAQKVLSSHNA